MVMPFGLTNIPAAFQDIMNHVLKDQLDEDVMVYIDDVLIYAKTQEKHNLLVKEVLKRLLENDLVISQEK
jgi:predicted transcriptional regulator